MSQETPIITQPVERVHELEMDHTSVPSYSIPTATVEPKGLSLAQVFNKDVLEKPVTAQDELKQSSFLKKLMQSLVSWNQVPSPIQNPVVTPLNNESKKIEGISRVPVLDCALPIQNKELEEAGKIGAISSQKLSVDVPLLTPEAQAIWDTSIEAIIASVIKTELKYQTEGALRANQGMKTYHELKKARDQALIDLENRIAKDERIASTFGRISGALSIVTAALGVASLFFSGGATTPLVVIGATTLATLGTQVPKTYFEKRADQEKGKAEAVSNEQRIFSDVITMYRKNLSESLDKYIDLEYQLSQLAKSQNDIKSAVIKN